MVTGKHCWYSYNLGQNNDHHAFDLSSVCMSRCCGLLPEEREEHLKVSYAIQFDKQGHFLGAGWHELCQTGMN